MLTLDRVDLPSLVDALSDHSYEFSWGLDRGTGEVVPIPSGHWDAEEEDSPEGDLVAIGPEPSHEGYQDMVDFIQLVPDARMRDQPDWSIKGRGAFRRFRDALYPEEALGAAWVRFSDHRRSRRAVRWLIDNDVVPQDSLDQYDRDHPEPDLAELVGGVSHRGRGYARTDAGETSPAPAADRRDGRGARPVAVVTGASSGIGAASARRLAADGFEVVLGARRLDRVEALAAELDGRAYALDVTQQDSVDAFCREVPECQVLVNNAGGAIGVDHVAAADVDEWRAMYDVNVLGVVRMTKALLPALVASGRGDVLIMGSTAGMIAYEGGGGYTAAKHGAHVVAETLRLELAGQPVRIMVVAPGMVATEEFSARRFRGDVDAAARVYAGVREPLVAEDVADVVGWMITRPHHVNIDLLVVRPLAQAAQHKVIRDA